MNKKILLTLMLGLGILNLGCSPKDTLNNEYINNNDSKIIIETSNSKQEVLKQDEIYNIHKELFPKIQKLFKDEKIDFILENNKNNNKSDEYTSAIYSDINNRIIGEYTLASYELVFDNNGFIKGIRIELYQNVDLEVMQKNSFKFEDTIFYNISNIVIKEDKGYSETNKEINTMIKNKDYNFVGNYYENIDEVISISDNDIAYTLYIKP